MSTGEGQVIHTVEGQTRPAVSVATWGSGDPGPVDGQGGIPSLKPPKCYRPLTPKQPMMDRQLKIFSCNLEHGDDVNCTRPDDLEAKEAEPRGEQVGEVGVGWGWRYMRAYGEGSVPDTQGAPQGLARSKG